VSYTPYNAPLLSGLLGDAETTRHFTVAAEISAMNRFEAALAKAEGDCGVIEEDAADAIIAACASFEPDIAEIGRVTARDSVIVPEFVRQLRGHVGETHGNNVHFGATSQDAIDTSFVLRMREVLAGFELRLGAFVKALHDIAERFGENEIKARTRMQAAMPITVAYRIDAWTGPLVGHLNRLAEVKQRFLVVQFGGGVGTLDKLGDKGEEVRATLARELDLSVPPANWHTDRSAFSDLAHWLSLVTGTLGKIGQDIALMAQDEISEIDLAGGGGSSAMPHKKNPVRAETLVALARFNAVQSSAMPHAMIHEQERSGAAWMLEWMILPQMTVATGAALRTAASLVEDIRSIGESNEGRHK
jgi:3-carboxy-cis,cis-muconate cycloisomerase